VKPVDELSVQRPGYVPAEISDEDVEFMRACGVIREDGSIDPAKTCLEMSDFRMVTRECSRVYEHFAGLTKPTTAADHVIAIGDDMHEQRVDEAIEEATEMLRWDVADARSTIADLVGPSQTNALGDIPVVPGEKLQFSESVRRDYDRLLRLRGRARFPGLIEHLQRARSSSSGPEAAILALLIDLLKGDET
jgi:hypothetical protein